MGKKVRSKRNNGEGTIRQRSNGRWEAAVMDGRRPDGKPRMKYFSGATKKEVRALLDRWKADKTNGLDTSAQYTFTDWSNLWFEHHKINITPTTQENYKYTLRILQEYFGSAYIMDIRTLDIEVFLNKLLADGVSDSSRTKCRAMLTQIFKKAAANDLVRKNPVLDAEKNRSKKPPKRKDAFTSEEVKTLMRDLPDNRMGWSIRLLLGTGMRSQELLALEPQHIEADGSIIHIEQAINLVKGRVHMGAPKSRDSYRDVPVPDCIRPYAIALRETAHQYIWQSPKKDDTPCNPSYFRDGYKKAIGTVEGVRYLSPHSCRHTFVSQMQALGVDIATIQTIVGHADIDMTTHYLHVQESVKQDAIEKFSNFFGVPNTRILVEQPCALF
jgi:integrase